MSDNTIPKGNMRYTENMIELAIGIHNTPYLYESSLFGLLSEGDSLQLSIDSEHVASFEKDTQPHIQVIKFTAIEESGILLEGLSGSNPNSYIFEAKAIERSLHAASDGDDTELFGILFPDGHTFVINASPDSERALSFVMAGLAMEGLI